MNIQHLHLIKGEATNLAYYSPTMDLFIINNITFSILKSLKENSEHKDIAKKLDINPKIVESTFQTWDTSSPTVDYLKTEEENSRVLERITLHVSNDCNLRCKYCYANGGTYQQKRSLMSLRTANQFIEFCLNNFDKIGVIVFFGGEPMLNLEVMEFICENFKKMYREERISFLPEFGIITNGTILNDRILNFIRENLSFVTISIDGLQKVNDANRIFANGKGSFDLISNFIHTVKQKTKVKMQYEATFTQFHIDNRYTHSEIGESLFNEFGINGRVIEELNIQPDCREEYWKGFDYKTWSNDCNRFIPDGFWSVMSTLKTKKPKQMCAIAHKTFAVAVNGEIYPCHINNGDKNTSLGNIASKNIFNDTLFKDECFPYNLKQNYKCENCWANSICGGCSRTWFYDEKNKIYQNLPKDDLCQWNKKHLENLLLLIANVRKDNILWQKIVHKKNC